MDASDRMRGLIFGFRQSQAVHVAAELGVADRLAAGPVTAGAVADEIGADPDALRRLLRALASIGVFEERPGDVFATTDLGRTLESRHPDRLRAVSANTGSWYFWDAWGQLEHSVRTGENAFESVHGVSVWEYRARHVEAATRFDAAMLAQTLRLARDVVSAYDFSACRAVVDVGGGHGALLSAVLDAYPGVAGVLYDLPHVVETAKPALAERGIADRVRLEGGSFFDGVPVGGDAYLLKSVLHDWEDDECVRILRACAAAMRDDAALLVVERALGGPNEEPETKFSDLNMLVLPGGRERSIDEFDALLAAAGLAISSVTATSTAFRVIVAVRQSSSRLGERPTDAAE